MPRGVKKDADRKPTVSKSARAELEMPVGRIGRHLRRGCYFKRYSDATAVYLAAVIEFLCKEVLDMAGIACKNDGRQRIKPDHIFQGIQEDESFVELFDNIVISEGGFTEHIDPSLLYTKKEIERRQRKAMRDAESQSDAKKSQSKSQRGRSKSKGKRSGSQSKKGKASQAV